MGAPGVVVEEVVGEAVTAVTGGTVPVFVGHFFEKDGSRLSADAGCIRIESALELRQRFPNDHEWVVDIVDGKATVSRKVPQYSVTAVQCYFENGGGPCYLMSRDEPTDKNKADQIREHGDISLIVAAYSSSMENTAYPLYPVIEPLLRESKGYFYLTAFLSATKIPASDAQMALYYPALKVPNLGWRDDHFIPVTGHDDPDIDTLAKLQSANPILYAEADTVIKNTWNLSSGTTGIPCAVPVAAAYSKTDRERGVWKAPANIAIKGATPYIIITDDQQAELTAQGINCIRRINGKTMIWGARTSALDSPEWRYISVRRLFNQVECDVTATLCSYVAAPNIERTWKSAKAEISGYLLRIWEQGGLKGGKPEEGYQVTIDRSTMTEADIAAGRLIARVELAAARPAEFMTLEFTQNLR